MRQEGIFPLIVIASVLTIYCVILERVIFFLDLPGDHTSSSPLPHWHWMIHPEYSGYLYGKIIKQECLNIYILAAYYRNLISGSRENQQPLGKPAFWKSYRNIVVFCFCCWCSDCWDYMDDLRGFLLIEFLMIKWGNGILEDLDCISNQSFKGWNQKHTLDSVLRNICPIFRSHLNWEQLLLQRCKTSLW